MTREDFGRILLKNCLIYGQLSQANRDEIITWIEDNESHISSESELIARIHRGLTEEILKKLQSRESSKANGDEGNFFQDHLLGSRNGSPKPENPLAKTIHPKKFHKLTVIAALFVSLLIGYAQYRQRENAVSPSAENKHSRGNSVAQVAPTISSSGPKSSVFDSDFKFVCKSKTWYVEVTGSSSNRLIYKSWKAKGRSNSQPEKTVSGDRNVRFSPGNVQKCEDDVFEFRGDDTWTYVVRRDTCGDRITTSAIGLLEVRKNGRPFIIEKCLKY